MGARSVAVLNGLYCLVESLIGEKRHMITIPLTINLTTTNIYRCHPLRQACYAALIQNSDRNITDSDALTIIDE